MSSEVGGGGGGGQALRTLTEKGPKRKKGPQSVCKNSKLLKKPQCQSKGPILETLGPLGLKSSPMKI